MTISYSILSTANYSRPGGTSYDAVSEFPDLLGNADFAYTVDFSNDTGTITSVSVTSSPLYTTETVLDSNSVRIARDSTEVMFSGESYDVVKFNELSNKTIENYLPLVANTSGADTSIFRWNIPGTKIVTGSYTFSITYTDSVTFLPVTQPVTFSQSLHWSITPGLALLLELVDRSYL